MWCCLGCIERLLGIEVSSQLIQVLGTYRFGACEARLAEILPSGGGVQLHWQS